MKAKCNHNAVMATLTIRDLPDSLDAALTKCAEKNRRSKEKQALYLLETAVGAATVDWNGFFESPKRSFDSVADEIRQKDSK